MGTVTRSWHHNEHNKQREARLDLQEKKAKKNPVNLMEFTKKIFDAEMRPRTIHYMTSLRLATAKYLQ